MGNRARRADRDAGRTRFLDAADRVFIEHGYTGSTIRMITQEAGTSLARLNRDWDGKLHLFRDVFGRHFDAIHAAQSERLDRLEAAGARGAIDVGAIIEAFFAPALSAMAKPADEQIGRRVYCRAITDAAPEAREIVEDLVSPMRARLLALLRRALPDADDTRLFLVFSAIFGTYVYPQLFGRELAATLGLDFESIDWDAGSGVLASLFRNGVG